MNFRLRRKKRSGTYPRLHHIRTGWTQSERDYNGGTWSCKLVLSAFVLVTAISIQILAMSGTQHCLRWKE